MCTMVMVSVAERVDENLLYWRFLLWAVVCFSVGRNVGKTIDIQYREQEGKPTLVTIQDRWKKFFHFRYFCENEVVMEGIITQILGYLFAVVELVVLILAASLNQIMSFVWVADWIVILFSMIVTLAVLLPMHIKYERNLQLSYDCDWITQLQEILTIYPKRRCVVVSQVNSSTYEIILGRLGRRIHIAKSTIPVVVGAKMFAVHSNEHGSPFWTIKDH